MVRECCKHGLERGATKVYPGHGKPFSAEVSLTANTFPVSDFEGAISFSAKTLVFPFSSEVNSIVQEHCLECHMKAFPRAYTQAANNPRWFETLIVVPKAHNPEFS